jgi:peptide/nickel transport system permease protein
MVRLLARRLASSLLLLFLLLTLLFFALHLAPGKPAALLVNPQASAEQRQRLVRLYGLDRPLAQRYLSWLGAALAGDFGTSYSHQRPAARVLAEALPTTLMLAAAATAVDLGLGLAFGVAAVRRREGALDHGLRAASLLLYSLPVFWLGLVAILLFAHLVPLLPAGHLRSARVDDLGWLGRQLDLAWHLALPALVLGLSLWGGTLRLLRASLLEVLGQDYITAARARGLPERRVLWVHALRNAALPLVQLFGVSFPLLLNGSLVVEVVFSLPGIGRLLFEAILNNDYPLVLAGTALSGSVVVAGTLASDLLHAVVDPRLRPAR